MADQPDGVSHGDIYHKLGALEGKLDAVIASVSEKRSDLADAFRRIGELERGLAKWAGIALAASIIIPMIVSAAATKLHFPTAEPANAESRR
jgi:hypothetical protein